MSKVRFHARRPSQISTTLSVICLCLIAFAVQPANADNKAKLEELKQAMTGHHSVLQTIRVCLSHKENRKNLLKALRKLDRTLAQQVKNTCISRRQLQSLRSGPSLPFSRYQQLGIDFGGTEDYFKSMSIGLGPSGAAVFGFTLDAGWVFDLERNGKIRPYATSGGGVGFQLNIGADPLVFNLYLNPVETGVSKSSAWVASVDGGFSITISLLFDRRSGSILNAPINTFQGFTAAFGVGAGINAGSKYDFRTRTYRVACKKVNIEVTNDHSKKAKVLDIDFHDYKKGKWHSKATINKRIKAGRTWTTKRRLNRMGGEQTQIRIKYKVKRKIRYGDTKRRWSSKKVCENGGTYRVRLR